jgi:hypothetical protein
MKIFTPVLGTQATVAQTAEGVEFSQQIQLLPSKKITLSSLLAQML